MEQTADFLTGALIFGGFLAGIVVAILAVIWMLGQVDSGNDNNGK